MFVLIILIIAVLYIYHHNKEKYAQPIKDLNSLENPRLVDLSKIDWSKLSDAQYSDLICQIEGCEERPAIKNLSI